jgi:hypothetical protein
MMFTELAQQSYGTTSGSHTLNMSSTNLKPAGDLMYAVFGPDTTLALPIIANLKQLKFDCPHDELIAVTFEADKEMSFFTDIIEINSVFMTFKMSFATQRPTLSSTDWRYAFGWEFVCHHC